MKRNSMNLLRFLLWSLILFAVGSGVANADVTVDGITYHEISHAHNNQLEHAARIRSLVEQIKAIERQLADVRSRAARLQSEITALEAEKKRVLDEYRQGAFCTGCDKARSEFAPGEAFPHAGQQVRGATPEELARKEKGYNDKIAAKQRELAALPNATTLETDRLALTNKLINNEIPWWAGCVDAEVELRKQAWENDKKNLKDKISQTQKSLSDANAAYNRAAAQAKPNPAVLDGMKTGIESLKTQTRNLQDDLPRLRESHVKTMDDFSRQALGAQKELADLCATIRDDMGLFSGTDIANKMRGYGWDFRLSFVDANPLTGLSLTPLTGLSSSGQTINDIKILLEGGKPASGIGLGAGAHPNFGLGGSDPKAVLEGKK